MVTMAPNDRPKQALIQLLYDVADNLEQIVEHAEEKYSTSKRRTDHQADEAAADQKLSVTKLLHALRVACRRAEAALQACPQLLSSKQVTWFHHQLRTLRKSCNVVRDDEVLKKWLKKQPVSDARDELLKSLSKRIKQSHAETAQQSRAILGRHHFRRHISWAWIDTGTPDGTPQSVTAALARWLFDAQNRFIQTIPDDPLDYAALHQLRIAAKHIRYGAEFAGEIMPHLRLRPLIAQLIDIQDKLGALHDAVVRLERLDAECSKPANAKQLIAAARRELEQSTTEWQAAWQLKTLQQVVKQTGTAVTRMLFLGHDQGS